MADVQHDTCNTIVHKMAFPFLCLSVCCALYPYPYPYLLPGVACGVYGTVGIFGASIFGAHTESNIMVSMGGGSIQDQHHSSRLACAPALRAMDQWQ